MHFKRWLENEEDEYAMPDEKVMRQAINTPLRCSNKPDLRGDRFIFSMPLGHTKDYLVRFGGIVGLRAVPGSLNAKCYQLYNDKKYGELFKLMQYLQFNNSPIIRKQLLSYFEK